MGRLFNLLSECLYESKNFDLISLGVKWTEGCCCFLNDLLRAIIPKLARNYANVVIDVLAGLEHLNRKVTSEADDLFIILNSSLKSMKCIERIHRLTKEVVIKWHNFYLVANHRFNQDTAKSIASNNGVYLGGIESGSNVEEYNLQGRSLLELPEDSPASLSNRRILIKAGYQVR